MGFGLREGCPAANPACGEVRRHRRRWRPAPEFAAATGKDFLPALLRAEALWHVARDVAHQALQGISIPPDVPRLLRPGRWPGTPSRGASHARTPFGDPGSRCVSSAARVCLAAEAEMRRTFWDEAFGRGAAENPAASEAGEGQSQELPEGLSRVRFPGTSGKEQPLVTMCRLTSVPGAALFWVAQAMLSWLSGLLDRQPEMGARGLEKVYLRAAPPRAGQDTLPRCPGLAPSRVHRRRKVPGVSAPSADCFAACGRRASLLQLDPCC